VRFHGYRRGLTEVSMPTCHVLAKRKRTSVAGGEVKSQMRHDSPALYLQKYRTTQPVALAFHALQSGDI
jgi:hypothetical protein